MKSETVKVEIVVGVEGKSIYIDGYRVFGDEPSGGGTILESFDVEVSEIKEAIKGEL